VSLPLIFVLTIICTNSMALTSWTPTGSLAKITQFTMGAIDRTNPAQQPAAGGMTSEIASNAANLLSDIKPGYMLGGKPRHQAIGHVIGILAGVLACVPLFYLLFLPPDANGLRSRASTIVSDQFAMPAALQWKGVADIIAKGLGAAHFGLDLDGLRGRGGRGVRTAAHQDQGALPDLGGRGGPGRGAAAGKRAGHVRWRTDLLVHGPQAQEPDQQGAPRLGRGHGAGLCRPDFRCRIDGHRQRHHQRADLRPEGTIAGARNAGPFQFGRR
jgi:hypothetical protein